MSNDENHNREREVRERIASFVQTDEPARRKRITQEELETLRAAAGRLDQLLARVAEDQQARSQQITDEDRRALSAAAGRLDHLLTRAAGKEAVTELKPRRPKKDITE